MPCVSCLGSPDNEISAGVDVHDGPVIRVVGRDDGVHHFFQHFLSQLLETDLGAVLHRHHHRVHPQGDARSVLDLVLAGHLEKDLKRFISVLQVPGNLVSTISRLLLYKPGKFFVSIYIIIAFRY